MQALRASFGITHAISDTTVVLLTHQGVLDALDAEHIARNVPFSDPSAPGGSRPWARGDAAQNVQGFASISHPGTVYVRSDNPLPTATTHEILHANTHPDFRSAVGEALNEGITEHLAIQAVQAAGMTAMNPDGSVAYPDQVAATDRLIAQVGPGPVTSAYFNGPQALVDAYETISGHHFSELKGDGSQATAHMAALTTPRTAAEKIGLVQAQLLHFGTGGLAEFAAQNAIRVILESDPAMAPQIKAAVSADLIGTWARMLSATSVGQDALQFIRSLGPSLDPAFAMLAFAHMQPSLNTEALNPHLLGFWSGIAPAFAEALRPLVSPALHQICSDLMDGWVSDEDIDKIELIYNSGLVNQVVIQSNLSPRLSSLWSGTQRTRLADIIMAAHIIE